MSATTTRAHLPVVIIAVHDASHEPPRHAGHVKHGILEPEVIHARKVDGALLRHLRTIGMRVRCAVERETVYVFCLF